MHSSIKMGSLDIELVYSTLCPSITSTHSTSKFHLNMFQYSIGGAVMLDAITYGKDCIRQGFLVANINEKRRNLVKYKISDFLFDR